MLEDAQSNRPIYSGVDVAGTKNIWIAGLSANNSELEVVVSPHLATLSEVLDLCEQQNVAAVAIDAQLTIALSKDPGFRTSDLRLRSLLPPDCRNWVASINLLMAVPVRGQLLADTLFPTVVTILETHPRASLFFGLKQDALISEAIRSYKKGEGTQAHIQTLWQAWAERYHVESDGSVHSDGALDAVVCAIVAYLLRRMPEKLLRLRHEVPRKTGRGPFYILAGT